MKLLRLCTTTLLGLLSVAGVHAAGKADEYYRNFWHPLYNGERLSYCKADESACGQKVASRYCQMLGYDYADQHIIAYNIDQTNFIDSDEHCKGWQCNGFMTIRCVGKISHTPPQPYYYRSQRFVYPRFNNFRVDWCYEKHGKCGQQTADSFCKRMGYMRAQEYAKQVHVASTKALGDEELCFGKECAGFSSITCYR
jgi:hypothetical protein